MKKLSTFFRTLFLSLTNPAYYQDILASKASFSWKYLLGFVGLLSLLISLRVMVAVARFNPEATMTNILAYYPSELAVTYDDRGLTINQTLPYSIPIPDLKPTDVIDQLPFDNLITFVTDQEVSLEAPQQHRSVVVIGQTRGIAVSDAHQLRAFDIDPSDYDYPFTIDLTLLNGIKQTVLDVEFIKHRWYVPLAGLTIWPVVLLGLIDWYLITLLFYTLIVWIIAQIFLGKKISYGQLYRLGFHSIGLVVIVDWVANYFGVPYFSGSVFLLIYLVWTLFIVSQIEMAQPAKAPKKKTQRPRSRSK